MQKTIVLFQIFLLTDPAVKVDIKCLSETADRFVVSSIEKSPEFIASDEVLVKEFGAIIGREVTLLEIKQLASKGEGVFALTQDGALLEDNSIPGTPVMTLDSVEFDVMNVSWTEPEDDGGNIVAYEIQQSIDGAPFVLAEVPVYGVNTYRFHSLLVGANHAFKVRAVDTRGNLGEFSNIVNADITEATPPA
jgi:hypothetical protein